MDTSSVAAPSTHGGASHRSRPEKPKPQWRGGAHRKCWVCNNIVCTCEHSTLHEHSTLSRGSSAVDSSTVSRRDRGNQRAVSPNPQTARVRRRQGGDESSDAGDGRSGTAFARAATHVPSAIERLHRGLSARPKEQFHSDVNHSALLAPPPRRNARTAERSSSNKAPPAHQQQQPASQRQRPAASPRHVDSSPGAQASGSPQTVIGTRRVRRRRLWYDDDGRPHSSDVDDEEIVSTATSATANNTSFGATPGGTAPTVGRMRLHNSDSRNRTPPSSSPPAPTSPAEAAPPQQRATPRGVETDPTPQRRSLLVQMAEEGSDPEANNDPSSWYADPASPPPPRIEVVEPSQSPIPRADADVSAHQNAAEMLHEVSAVASKAHDREPSATDTRDKAHRYSHHHRHRRGRRSASVSSSTTTTSGTSNTASASSSEFTLSDGGGRDRNRHSRHHHHRRSHSHSATTKRHQHDEKPAPAARGAASAMPPSRRSRTHTPKPRAAVAGAANSRGAAAASPPPVPTTARTPTAARSDGEAATSVAQVDEMLRRQVEELTAKQRELQDHVATAESQLAALLAQKAAATASTSLDSPPPRPQTTSRLGDSAHDASDAAPAEDLPIHPAFRDAGAPRPPPPQRYNGGVPMGGGVGHIRPPDDHYRGAGSSRVGRVAPGYAGYFVRGLIHVVTLPVSCCLRPQPEEEDDEAFDDTPGDVAAVAAARSHGSAASASPAPAAAGASAETPTAPAIDPALLAEAFAAAQARERAAASGSVPPIRSGSATSADVSLSGGANFEQASPMVPVRTAAERQPTSRTGSESAQSPVDTR